MSDIKDKLTAYQLDPENEAVQAYFEKDNIWTILNIQRYEPSHSAFFAWFLRQEVKQFAHIRALLILLIDKAKEDILKDNWNNTVDMSFFKNAVRSGSYTINSVLVKTEQVINKLSQINSYDKLDVYIRCDIVLFDQTGKEHYKILEIIIENKVDSKEGKTKEKGFAPSNDFEKKYSNLTQTHRYYYACSKENGLRLKNDVDYQLFVFLTPDGKRSDNDNYILITYQDLVDYLFKNYLKRTDIAQPERELVESYLHNLGNPYHNKKREIIAMSDEERELLVSFFKRNEELFLATMEAMQQKANKDGDYETAQKWQDSINSIKEKKLYRLELPNGEVKELKNHTALAYNIALFLAENCDKETLLNDYEKLEFKGTCQKGFIQKDNKNSTGGAITCKDGEVYCNNQWVPDKVKALIEKVVGNKKGIKISIL